MSFSRNFLKILVIKCNFLTALGIATSFFETDTSLQCLDQGHSQKYPHSKSFCLYMIPFN